MLAFRAIIVEWGNLSVSNTRGMHWFSWDFGQDPAVPRGTYVYLKTSRFDTHLGVPQKLLLRLLEVQVKTCRILLKVIKFELIVMFRVSE